MSAVLLGETREQDPGRLVHPEWVGGRRLWMESAMSVVIHKLHYGDPVRGWEGDPRLAVYWNPPRWEVMRLEADGEYRMVCRSLPGVPFDERLIDNLIAWDLRRNPHVVDQVMKRNLRMRDEVESNHRVWLDEEIAPRLRRAMENE